MPMNAMRLRRFSFRLRVTQSAEDIYDVVKSGSVSHEVMIFMSPLSFFPNVSAITAWKRVWMGTPSTPYLYIDPLSGLELIPISRRIWRRTKTTPRSPLYFGFVTHSLLNSITHTHGLLFQEPLPLIDSHKLR